MSRFVLLCMLMLVHLPAAAAAELRPRTRASSETIIESPEGLAYRVRVSVPQGRPPANGFPVIYVLDGDAWFGSAVEIARIREWSRLPPAILVGVGYPGAHFFDAQRRMLDFTPPGSSDPDSGFRLGGADRFLAFLDATLKPWVGSNYPADPRTRILYGHSMGGLFALHALFKSPASFSAYVAASPTLRFGDHVVLRGEAAFLKNPARVGPRLLVTTGEFEPQSSPEQIEDYRRYFGEHPEDIPGQTPDQAVAEIFAADGYDKAADLEALVARLSRAGVRASFVKFAGDEHTPAGISALNRGIAFGLRPASN